MVDRRSVNGGAVLCGHHHAVALVGGRKRVEPIGQAFKALHQFGVAFIAATGQHNTVSGLIGGVG